MNIRYRCVLVGRIYETTVSLDVQPGVPAISPVDLEKLAQHGDILVNVGGTLNPESGDDLDLDDRNLRLPTEFPIKQSFSLDDYDNAASLAAAWWELVSDNILTALTTLRATPSVTFEGVVRL